MINKYFRLIHTIKYLKPKQIYYRIYYILRSKFRKISRFSYMDSIVIENITPLVFPMYFKYKLDSYKKENHFTFLNISHAFSETIDWNYTAYGKLWTYNLTYFDYLRQEEMRKEEGEKLMRKFVDAIPSIKDGLMPFPISLRGINWIIFLSTHKIDDAVINASLYAQYHRLYDNLEYHILGNHLLENAFSLLFGAYYFQDDKLYKKAYAILTEELSEQILSDGAHFELSPMYHQIMLFRVLDCINLIKHNYWKDDVLYTSLVQSAQKMLGWLEEITYANGNIPLFNDSTNDIAPRTEELVVYAKELGIKSIRNRLSACGYRKVSNTQYECVIDVGNIGPDYIPGHAHSDTFNFELYINQKPFIVDTGLSTYETNERRTQERSTDAHNTVEINGKNQTEVWGGFRVAKRAKIISLIEKVDTIEASHDGYKELGCIHTRKWHFQEAHISIKDSIEANKSYESVGYLHFHPDVMLTIEGNTIVTPMAKIVCEEATMLSISEYNYASKFNTLLRASCVMVRFDKNITMEIGI